MAKTQIQICSFQVVHNLPEPSPSSPRAQLEPWAQRSLQELRSLTSEQSLLPSPLLPSPLLASPSAPSFSRRRKENTIEDTLAQLSALAGGPAKRKTKDSGPSLQTMDQDKPILSTPAIKEEKQ